MEGPERSREGGLGFRRLTDELFGWMGTSVRGAGGGCAKAGVEEW